MWSFILVSYVAYETWVITVRSISCMVGLGLTHNRYLENALAGVLTRHPEETILAGFQAESAWMVGAWSDVQKRVDTQNSSVAIARVLLATREGNSDVVETML